MFEYVKNLDVKILLTINSLHSPFIDKCMIVITHRYTWIPFYFLILVFLYIKKKKDFFVVTLFIIAAAI